MFNFGDDSMQMMKRGWGLASAVMVAWMVAPVQAHHSFAMFDMTKSVVLKGTVTEFQWTNPHSWLQVKVLDEHGESTEWSIELGSLSGLRQAGWKPRTFQPGDKVTVTAHPLRDGKKGGSLVSVVLPNGQVLGGGGTGQGPQDQSAPPKGQ
jgi:phage-related protein